MPEFRNRIIELAEPGDEECVEKLLGFLATLQGSRAHGSLRFVPPAMCEDLAAAAAKALTTGPFGRP